MTMLDMPAINYRVTTSRKALTWAMGLGVIRLLLLQMGLRPCWYLTVMVEERRHSLSLFIQNLSKN